MVPPQLLEGGDECSGHLSSPIRVSTGTESPPGSVTAPSHHTIKFHFKPAPIPSPHHEPQPSPPKEKKKKKKIVRRQSLPTVAFPGVTRREFSSINKKMDRVLTTVSAYPAPATDAELNSRLTKVVQDVVDKQLTAAMQAREERMVELEQAAANTIKLLGDVVEVIKNDHAKEIDKRDKRIRDLEELNFQLIRAGGTMVSMTMDALYGPTSDLTKIKADTSSLLKTSAEQLKTSSEHFDSLSKAISLSTSSLMERIASLKLEEVVPRSKGGEDEEDNDKHKRSPINLEKTPPRDDEEEDHNKTPPATNKGKDTAAGPSPPKKTTPKTTDNDDQAGPSSPPKDDEISSGFELEDEEEEKRKAERAEQECLGLIEALRLEEEQKQDEARRIEERKLREREKASRQATYRPLITRVPPSGNDIVPFITYDLPGPNEVLDCPVSKNVVLLPMIDQIGGETNPTKRAAAEFKRSRNFVLRHASTRADLFSRSRIASLISFKTRSFQKSRYCEYGITRADGSSKVVNSTDLHLMNHADLLVLGRICRHKAETKREITIHHLTLCTIINAIVEDFGYEDAELHKNFPDAPLFKLLTLLLMALETSALASH